ncbi:MAG: EfeM/EfeO family lipoprotein [Solirubrobacteraceae bacterium]
MSESPSSTALPRPSGPGRLRPGRPVRLVIWVGAVALLAIATLVAAAVIPGSHHSSTDNALAQRAVAAPTAPSHGPARVKKVFDSSISAKRYGTQISQMENGYNASGPVSDLSPLSASAFNHPVAVYRRYAERWAAALGQDVVPLTVALRAGNRGLARRDWATAFSDYLHLGAVYGLLPGDLNDDLAGMPGEIGDRHFVGLHRIEMGLWTNQPVTSLAALGVKLSSAVGRLRAALPSAAVDPQSTQVRLARGLVAVTVDPLDFTLRIHEILEDAQRDFMSGLDVPWSGAGVLATAIGVTATRELLATVKPIMTGRGNAYGNSEYWLQRLGRVFDSVRRRDGSYPSLHQLTPDQLQLIDGTLAGTLTALEQVPATLETTNFTTFPNEPAGGTK